MIEISFIAFVIRTTAMRMIPSAVFIRSRPSSPPRALIAATDAASVDLDLASQRKRGRNRPSTRSHR